jgi:hypothetical protein
MSAVIETAAQTAPCIATGGDRIFSDACLSCTAYAIGCSPVHPTGARDDGDTALGTPTDDLKALQRACANSPCLATGGDRTFSGACLSCPAYALWCFPSRPLRSVEPSAVA